MEPFEPYDWDSIVDEVLDSPRSLLREVLEVADSITELAIVYGTSDGYLECLSAGVDDLQAIGLLHYGIDTINHDMQEED